MPVEVKVTPSKNALGGNVVYGPAGQTVTLSAMVPGTDTAMAGTWTMSGKALNSSHAGSVEVTFGPESADEVTFTSSQDAADHATVELVLIEAAPPPPVMALRTYTALRLGSVGVIAILAIAIIKEYNAAGHCLQGSISAYYYTSVQSIFVGTLLTLGLVMIALWGKTSVEDGFLNLAGLLAAVVAFVPTNDTNKCGIIDATGEPVGTTGEKNTVIDASEKAVENNMTAYLIVVLAILLIVFFAGVFAKQAKWTAITENPKAYWGPWVLALILWIFIAYKFWKDRAWIYDHAHDLSAKTMFGFIGIVVVTIGVQKWTGKHELDGKQHKNWAFTYWALAALMLIGAFAIPALIDNHQTFWLEAWEIFLLAVFWGFQTKDRWNEGAPPRTDAEKKRMAPAIF